MLSFPSLTHFSSVAQFHNENGFLCAWQGWKIRLLDNVNLIVPLAYLPEVELKIDPVHKNDIYNRKRG
jgi:hypothetical protein